MMFYSLSKVRVEGREGCLSSAPRVITSGLNLDNVSDAAGQLGKPVAL